MSAELAGTVSGDRSTHSNIVRSLVPRGGGGRGERVPGTHCLRMRVIIAKATWQN